MRSVTRGLALLSVVVAACGKVEGSAPDAAAGPPMIQLHNAIGGGQTASQGSLEMARIAPQISRDRGAATKGYPA